MHYDWIVIGSGFGGSVSSLRLVEKGYSVLTIEKGKRFAKEDFPKRNWDLKRWMWNPTLGMHGIFQMSFMSHVTVLHGVGVGGGSLVYANTLPKPTSRFFEASSWAHLSEDWQAELDPHYETARRMLGSTPYPGSTDADAVLESIAADLGRKEHFHKTDVAVFFGEPDVEVDDPFFDGEGPPRTGCNECGGCMTGCRYGAKNTLDLNYLWLAERRGLTIEAETEVTSVRPRDGGGYEVTTRCSTDSSKPQRSFTADNIVFAGGVMGTVPLLLRLRDDPEGLPNLSPRVGESVRTNSEALMGIVQPGKTEQSRGIAITSILHTDDHSHIEPVRYGKGSGFFRALVLPHAPGKSVAGRLGRTVAGFVRRPLAWAKTVTVRDFADSSTILLYMRTLDGTLTFELGKSAFTGFREGLVSKLPSGGTPPVAFMEAATDLAHRWAEKTNGVAVGLLTETLIGTPSTAHILGGACMGNTPEEGVIDPFHRVHGYEGLYVVDGSAISANPGVNPSLTITALAERAMSFIPPRESPQ